MSTRSSRSGGGDRRARAAGQRWGAPPEPPVDLLDPATYATPPAAAVPSAAPPAATAAPSAASIPVPAGRAPAPAVTAPAPPAAAAESSLVPRVVMVVALCSLVTAVLAFAHVGPFRSAPAKPAAAVGAGAPSDIRGTWNVLVIFQLTFTKEQMEVATENRSSGVVTGSVTSPVGAETLTGRVLGSTFRFTIGFGTGTETGTASVVTDAGQTRMTGDFSNAEGGHGTISAVRTAG